MVSLVDWTDIPSVDDAQESKELNACYLKVGDEIVRCYMNHEFYFCNIYGKPEASKEAGFFMVGFGYEPILMGDK